MCDICPAGCQGCGIDICFDSVDKQGWPATAYVTASGDLFCYYCGREIDREEEENYDEFDYDYSEV